MVWCEDLHFSQRIETRKFREYVSDLLSVVVQLALFISHTNQPWPLPIVSDASNMLQAFELLQNSIYFQFFDFFIAF